jgi:hypothetical protein
VGGRRSAAFFSDNVSYKISKDKSRMLFLRMNRKDVPKNIFKKFLQKRGHVKKIKNEKFGNF